MKQNTKHSVLIQQDLPSAAQEMETLIKDFSCCESWNCPQWEIEDILAQLECLCMETCEASCYACLDQAKSTMGILEKEAWIHHMELLIEELSEKK